MEGEGTDERTFTVSFPWRDFSLNYLLNGLQGQDFNMHWCVCQRLCVCVMARYGALSSISHMPSLPKACGIVEEKNWIKVILSLCSSSPQSLSSCLNTHNTHTHTTHNTHTHSIHACSRTCGNRRIIKMGMYSFSLHACSIWLYE